MEKRCRRLLVSDIYDVLDNKEDLIDIIKAADFLGN
tara:strand:- start:119 stop:226 length:108 start_codon:yes stop_codon:yes gene_type:complete